VSAEVVRHALEITRTQLVEHMHDLLRMTCERDVTMAVFLIRPGGTVVLATWLASNRPLDPCQILASLIDRYSAMAAVVLTEIQWTRESRAACLAWCFPVDGVAHSSFYVEELGEVVQELPDPDELVPDPSLGLWLEDRLELV
jgi:hypothetical protein